MSVTRDQAVVLRRLDYSETSQVLALFTRDHGKVRAIAKGIKRGTKTRFAVGIDLLDIGHVLFTDRVDRRERLATITEWKQSLSLSGLRESLPRIQAAQYCAEITAALTEDWDPHVELFDALVEALHALAESTEPLSRVVRYQTLLLDAIGSLPRFDACVQCERDTDLTHFSSFDGGMVCRHCESNQVEKRLVSAPTAHRLQAWAVPGASLGEAPVADLRGPFSLLNYHLSHLIGHEPALATALVPKIVQRTTG